MPAAGVYRLHYPNIRWELFPNSAHEKWKVTKLHAERSLICIQQALHKFCTVQSCFKTIYLKNIHLPSFNITSIFLISATKLLVWVLYCCQHICFVVSDKSGHFNRHILSATKAFLLCGPFNLGPITGLHGSKGAPSFHTYAEDQILQLPHVATNCCVQSRHPPEAQ